MKKSLVFFSLLGLGMFNSSASVAVTMDAYANTTTVNNPDYVMGFNAGKAACLENPASCGIAMPEMSSMWMTRSFGLPRIHGLRTVGYTAMIKIPMARLKVAPGQAPVCFKDIYMAAVAGIGWWGFVPFSLQEVACPQTEMPDLGGLDQLIAPLQ